MNFTPNNFRSVVYGTLTVAVVGLISWASHVAPTPIAAKHDAAVLQGSFQANNPVLVIPALRVTRAPGFRTPRTEYYQPVSWYGSKHWWKRNAPIVGGAAGGAMVGGLAGGGTGALIGGAIGGGGGYAYKRYRHHHHH